jgi:hypothetical protein
MASFPFFSPLSPVNGLTSIVRLFSRQVDLWKATIGNNRPTDNCNANNSHPLRRSQAVQLVPVTQLKVKDCGHSRFDQQPVRPVGERPNGQTAGEGNVLKVKVKMQRLLLAYASRQHNSSAASMLSPNENRSQVK